MRKLKRILVAVLMGTMISVGAFAQRGNDNRPPKDNPKVVEKPKPPPNNNNNQNNSNRPRKP